MTDARQRLASAFITEAEYGDGDIHADIASVLASLRAAEEALAGGVQVVATLLDAGNPIDWRPAREWAEAADVLLQGADK